MQGRLLPKYKNRFQAHPVGMWEQEFLIAKNFKLSHIEFILDYNNLSQNPLIYEGGIEKIKKISIENNIKILSICADYLMEAPLHSKDNIIREESIEVINNLIKKASLLNVKDIVIPCVDHSSLNTKIEIELFIKSLEKLIPTCEEYKVNLSLETDLEPIKFAKLLKKINSKNIKINYDTGNSAALGYNPIEELDNYGHLISVIHIKDRIYKGGSVLLGEGSCRFEDFFLELKKYNYKGIFTMQVYRDDEGVQIFKRQLDWFTNFLKNTYN